MDEENKEIIIKSGNGNKTIGSYVDTICKNLIDKKSVIFKAYNNNMNKLITIEQIIKRTLDKNNNKIDNDSKINYEIGKEDKIPFIKCTIKINNTDINNLKELIGNKNNKRNRHPFDNEKDKNMQIELENKNKKLKIDKNEKEEDKINELCINNINEFFK